MNTSKIQIEFGASCERTPVQLKVMPEHTDRRSHANIIKLDTGATSGKPTDAAIPNHQLVERLSRSPLFRDYQRAFEDAMGLPLTMRAVESWQLAHNGNGHQNGFCALMARANHSCAACLQVQQRVCDGVNGVPCTLSCSFGISETAVGVKLGQEIIAYLQTGQIFFQPPTPRQTSRALKQLGEWNPDLDQSEAARLYQETPVVSRDEYQARVRLLQFFADQLGALANQIVLQERDAEPAQITRARRFIEENYQEQLSLATVARQAAMNLFYFCRVFKRATGVNFTNYVCRVRVEKAKSLLLNLNYRVSEIAFEVGFQSLTHFNRVFKSITGESPSEYRRHLQAN